MMVWFRFMVFKDTFNNISVISTDWTGSCKFNYHTITTMTARPSIKYDNICFLCIKFKQTFLSNVHYICIRSKVIIPHIWKKKNICLSTNPFQILCQFTVNQYSEICLDRNLNKPESCINRTLNKVPM
jgi:hypothetical protein